MNINYFLCTSRRDWNAIDVCSWVNCLLVCRPPIVPHRIWKNYKIGLKEKWGGGDLIPIPPWPRPASWCLIYRGKERFLVLYVIYQTRGRVPHHDVQTPRSMFFNNFEVFGYPDETLFRVFDIASQTNQYLKSKLR